ncbi:MAG: type II and III secretion system protein [Ignavibacteriaceae bacterium]|nr:type II and III secretion system protein [Ignavibacteriaceae bacterium]
MKTIQSFLILLLLLHIPAMAQPGIEKQLGEYVPHDEVVSMASSLPFSKAIELMSKISEKKTGRPITTTFQREDPIGLDIINVQYEKALLMIVQYAGLILEYKEDVIIIRRKVDTAEEIKPEVYAGVDSREIKISAIFFEADVNETRERGINWELALSGKGFNFGTGTTTTGQVTTDGGSVTSDFKIGTSSEFGAGSLFGEAMTLFRFFESENIGEIIASPTVTVRNKRLGTIQSGSDFSIKQRDFAGNVTDQFFSTGSIINVTPYIYTEDGVEYMLLDLTVERSSGFPSELSTEIRKTKVTTQVLMLDGESTVIGGLYLNEEKTVRTGIPYLRDLPWWVLGIRYLTGSDQVSVIKKELVIVIKAEFVATLKERLAMPSEDGIVDKEVESLRERIRKSKENSLKNEKKD